VKYLVTQQKCDINLKDEKGVCPLGYTVYCILKEVTVLSPLDSLCKKLHTEHVQVAKFLLVNEVYVTSSELCILRLPLYSDSKFAVFKLMVDSLKHKLQSTCKQVYFEISKCLEIAVTENKWGFAENLVRTYADIIKMSLTSDSVQVPVSTPDCLHVACDKGIVEFVRTFLQFNICKPDANSVKIAIDGNHYEVLSLLLKSAHPSVLMDGYETWSSLLSYVFERHQDDRKITKIIVAAAVNTSMVDTDGNSPLHLACKYSVAHVMKEYKCYQSTLNNNQELPLHIACKTLKLEIVKLVSSQIKTNVSTLDLDGNTPLHIICHSLSSNYQIDNLLDCCKYLIVEKKRNGDLNIQNDQGELPFHVLLKNPQLYYDMYNSSTSRKWEKLTAILSNNSSFKVNSQDSSGNTLLHIACMKNYIQPLLYLTSNFSCNLDLINSDGYLPLYTMH
jgi:ankyrin repeat protein